MVIYYYGSVLILVMDLKSCKIISKLIDVRFIVFYGLDSNTTKKKKIKSISFILVKFVSSLIIFVRFFILITIVISVESFL